jgi:hypothetical protein
MRHITFWLSLGIVLGCALPASAQTEDYRVIATGPGGASFDDLCHGSDVLIGFNYTAYDALNTIAGVCETQDNGITTGVSYGLNTHGTAVDHGGGLSVRFGIEAAPRCPGAMAIHEMTVSLDKYNEVQGIDAICAGLVSSDTRSPTHIYAQTDGTAVTNKHITCNSGDIAHGLIGQSGPLINGVGLQCATFPWSRVAIVTPPPPPLAIHFVGVIADTEIYSACTNPKADLGILRMKTTLVSLIKVGPPDSCPGWYQLVWPGAPPNSPTGELWVYSAAPGPNVPAPEISLDGTSLASAEAALGGGH